MRGRHVWSNNNNYNWPIKLDCWSWSCWIRNRNIRNRYRRRKWKLGIFRVLVTKNIKLSSRSWNSLWAGRTVSKSKSAKFSNRFIIALRGCKNFIWVNRNNWICWLRKGRVRFNICWWRFNRKILYWNSYRCKWREFPNKTKKYCFTNNNKIQQWIG